MWMRGILARKTDVDCSIAPRPNLTDKTLTFGDAGTNEGRQPERTKRIVDLLECLSRAFPYSFTCRPSPFVFTPGATHPHTHAPTHPHSPRHTPFTRNRAPPQRQPQALAHPHHQPIAPSRDACHHRHLPSKTHTHTHKPTNPQTTQPNPQPHHHKQPWPSVTRARRTSPPPRAPRRPRLQARPSTSRQCSSSSTSARTTTRSITCLCPDADLSTPQPQSPMSPTLPSPPPTGVDAGAQGRCVRGWNGCAGCPGGTPSLAARSSVHPSTPTPKPQTKPTEFEQAKENFETFTDAVLTRLQGASVRIVECFGSGWDGSLDGWSIGWH